jgi:acid stress-induced BolA-like protein IbaG/YrbA
MPLQILNSPGTPDRVLDDLRSAIEGAIPGAEVEVRAASPGHFEIRVVSDTFAGQTRVQQQQAVYASIAALMKGDMAPVHAIDQLLTATP